MFLTRLGPSAQAVITGDLSQIDLPHNQKSGLRQAIEMFGNIEGIAITHLNTEDVVRHRLVKDILRAYEKFEIAEQARIEAIKKAREEEYALNNPPRRIEQKAE
jgi:phosphate starvation-inducible PhoH-like protein